jgi:uncharacterized protein (TIGR03118 family)
MRIPAVCRQAIVIAATFALLSQMSAVAQRYIRKNLTTDSAAVSPASNIDTNLVNAWGLARATNSFWWVSDNGTGLSTLYNASGQAQSLVVTVLTPDGTGSAAPTGAVFNPTSAFEAAPGKKSIFLFVTEDGTISGWNPGVNLTSAVVLVNRSGKASYKGCAIAQTSNGPHFYAANFVSGQVEIFDASFKAVHLGKSAFRLPDLSDEYSAFNIQNVGGNLVVTFAHREPGEEDEDHGPGLGRVGIFDPQGHLLLALKTGPWFNAPWGVALAPGDFGKFSHRLLIGNFGDGTIHAFNVVSGKHEGMMLDAAGQALAIDGLWAISFGGEAPSGSPNRLFFTAGPNDESDGLFGRLTALASEQLGNSE